MNITKIGTFLIFCCFAFINPILGQKYSNEFLGIGVGARAQAMGNAQTALAQDVTAGVWNPAGLNYLGKGLQVGAMHSEWFAGVGKYDYVGFAKQINGGKQTVALSYIRFGIDNIPNTLSLYEEDGSINYNNIQPFSATDNAFLLSYAQKIKGLNLGGSAKIIRRKIGPFAGSWGFGIDLGISYKKNNWTFAALGKDLTSTFNAWKFSFTDDEKEILSITGNDIPISSVEITRPQLILATAYQKKFGKIGLNAEVDLNVTTDGKRNVLISGNPFSIDPVLGVEMSYKDFVYLRGGMNHLQKYLDVAGSEKWSNQPSAGLGVKVYKIRLDYAFANSGSSDQSNYSHVVSLLIDFDSDYFKNAIRKN